ncbi:Hachiman antiphage defense system protein HamA [Sporanaerobacter acetigenes]
MEGYSDTFTVQDKMIGKHPTEDSVFATCLVCRDMPCSNGKVHRSLMEIDCKRDDYVKEIAKWLIKYHLSERKKYQLKKKKEMLEKYEFKKYADSLNIFPTSDKTRKGNLGEVVLSEYLSATSNIDILIYRLRYNPNVDQSMKGDDVLLVDNNRVLVGESKFRSKADKKVVDDISNKFGVEIMLPTSLSFIADRLYDEHNYELAEKVSEVEACIPYGSIDIKNIGLIVSDSSAHRAVERHMSSKNKNFLIITMNIDDPIGFLNSTFNLAKKGLEGELSYVY